MRSTGRIGWLTSTENEPVSGADISIGERERERESKRAVPRPLAATLSTQPPSSVPPPSSSLQAPPTLTLRRSTPKESMQWPEMHNSISFQFVKFQSNQIPNLEFSRIELINLLP